MDENKSTAAQGAPSEAVTENPEGTQDIKEGAAKTEKPDSAAKEQDGIMQKLADFLSRGDKKASGDKSDKPDKAAKTYTQAEFEAALAEAMDKATAGGNEKTAENDVQKELAELKAQLLHKELRETAAAELKKNNLPDGLAPLLDYSSKEKLTASLKTVTESFNSSLEAALKERLKGRTPAGLGQSGSTEENLADQVAKAIKGGLS